MAKKSTISLATLDDYRASFPETLTSEEETQVTNMLLNASNYLRQIGFNNHIDIDERIAEDQSGVYGANVKMVLVSAVQRVVAAPSGMVPDASSWSQSASPYSESMSFAGGSNTNIYFKNKELKLLGLGSVSGNKIAILKGVRG